MTDYNDGKWHGWNGGECPVDPYAKIEAVFLDETAEQRPLDWFGPRAILAGKIGRQCWVYTPGYRRIIAFRVTKPAPPKPREWWLTNVVAHESETAARMFRDKLEEMNPGVNFAPIIHVREVIE